MKFMTAGEAETKRQKAVEFLRRIGNDDLAGEFASMSPAEYAEHKGVQLMQNPDRKRKMATNNKSKADLEQDLEEDANDYIDQLEGKLNDIIGIASDDDNGDNSDSDDDSGSEDDDDTD